MQQGAQSTRVNRFELAQKHIGVQTAISRPMRARAAAWAAGGRHACMRAARSNLAFRWGRNGFPLSPWVRARVAVAAP